MDVAEEKDLDEQWVTIRPMQYAIPTFAWSTGRPEPVDGYMTGQIIIQLPTVPPSTMVVTINGVREKHFELLHDRAAVRLIEDIIVTSKGPKRLLRSLIIGDANGRDSAEYFLIP